MLLNLQLEGTRGDLRVYTLPVGRHEQGPEFLVEKFLGQ